MSDAVYRYEFGPEIDFDEAMSTLNLAVVAATSLHGEELARLDARFESDPLMRRVAIDASTPIGLGINQLFTGFLRREFCDSAFVISRIERVAPCLRSDLEREKES